MRHGRHDLRSRNSVKLPADFTFDTARQPTLALATVQERSEAPTHQPLISQWESRFARMLPSNRLSGLLVAVAAGQRDAFKDLYHASAPKLFGLILRIVRDRAIAEEIAQETFVAIWENAPRFDPQKGSAIAWLCTIARHRALDYVRRKTLAVSGKPVEEHAIADSAKTPLQEAESREGLMRLNECLDKLDPQHAVAIRRAYLDGASRAELAEEFGVPVNTVKTWLHRNLLKLRDCLEDE